MLEKTQTGRPAKEVIDGKQQCSRCHAWKVLAEFGNAKHTVNKLETRCRACNTERTIKRANSSLENALKVVLNRHHIPNRYRSDRRQRLQESSTISLQMLIDLWHRQDGRCAVTGVPMTRVFGNTRRVFANVSLDRIDNEFGYAPDNVRLVCKAVNLMKNAMTDQELVQWCALIVNGTQKP